MARRPKYLQTVDAARDEALNAIEFYNRPDGRRPLESFLVHMHIAWSYLLHAEFERDSVKYFYRDPQRPDRYLRVDGQKKTWELLKCVAERWSDESNPVRRNLELTIQLRNRVEHRYEAGLIVASAGFTQSLVMNFEDELIQQFGDEFSIADIVHLPVALSTFSREGAARLLAAQQSLPTHLREFFIGFRAGLSDDVRNDKKFEFRVDLLQKRTPTSDADLAVSFVREEDLSPADRAAYAELEKTGRVIIREKHRPVANLDLMLPEKARSEIERLLPFKFSMNAFVVAYKSMSVRPPWGASESEKPKTKQQYCVFDDTHGDYLYTQKFVEVAAKKSKTKQGFEKLIGRSPILK